MSDTETPKKIKVIRIIAPPPEEFDEFAKYWFLVHKTYKEWMDTLHMLRGRLGKINPNVETQVKVFTIPMAALRKMFADLGLELPTSLDERILAVNAIAEAGFLELEEDLQVSAIVSGFAAQAIGKPRRQ